MKLFSSATQSVPVIAEIPQHIAAIMDGNGRWARKRFLPRVAGHKVGVDTVRDLVKHCINLKVDYLTLFAFSSENWRRPIEEVSFLMGLFMDALKREVVKLHQNNIRLLLIGDRSRFDGIAKGPLGYFGFMPGKRLFQANDVVILDTAPFVEGCAADIGFTFSLVPNPQLLKAREFLLELRKVLPQMFLDTNLTAGAIWQAVDQQLRARGYDNCHAHYPLEALGHRLHFSSLSDLPALAIPFSVQSYITLLSRGLFPEVLSPWHVGSKTGLWAIETQVGGHHFGAKFEEILVVEKDRAYWLDEQVPHVTLPAGFF